MALVLKDRVQETATPNTTVSFTCTGPVTGFQAFSVIGNGNTTYYTAVDGSGNWESGLGTYTTAGSLVTRTTISASSNAGSAVTFSGAVSLFVNYPATKSVNLDASGNVSALGTVASGTWQGSTVGVAYGGTGVTTSTGANSVVLRDADENIVVNSVTQELTKTVSSAAITTLTAASSHFQVLTGTTTQTYKLPDATSLPTGSTWVFDNDSTGNLTVTDNAGATVDVVAAGGYSTVFLEANGTVGGEWGRFGMIPAEVNWGTNSLNLGGSTLITNGTWNGATIAYNYGGTGLTSFAAANNAIYSTSASALTAGTLPVLAGGTGVTTSTGTGSTVLSTSPTLVTPALGTPSSGTLTNCTFPTLNQNTSGTAAGLSATLVATSGGTGTATTAIGDLLQGAATNTWAKLPAVATGNALISGGVTTASSWGKIGLTTHISGTLAVGNGGTGVTTSTGSGSTVLSISPTLVTPALGTPSALVGTNITGTATNFTASNVTTNANLTGDVTSVGNATTLTNAPVIAKVLTGYVSGAGTVAATDSILQAIQKLNGNDATNANLTGMVTSVGNATTVVTNANLTGAVTSVGNTTSLGSFTSAQLLAAITNETGTGSLVFATSPTLVTPVLGTPSSGNLSSCTSLPISTGVSGLGANVSTFLTTPTSSNLNTVVTDNTGTGSLVFATSPTLVTPLLGTPTSGVLTNCTGTASGLTAGNVSNVGTKSLAASGYQTLSGGIYIQWGTIAGATTSVTFPVAFPTACGACCVMYVGATSTTSGIAATVTRTGFSIVATGLSRNWIAVGY